jgi:sigma-B regulation protein RsbU (phosphoserine phosphatase)
LVDELPPCCRCDGHVERELIAVEPAVDVCLECMSDDERHQLQDDLREAQAVNRSLQTKVFTRNGSWEVGIHYAASRILSGDFYDLVVHESDQRLSLSVGDVAGKGIPAGLLRASLQATLRVLCQKTLSPAALLGEANQHFAAFGHPGRFASVFYGVLGSDDGTFVYANGGHLPPYLKRASGHWETLGTTGAVLGLFDELEYEEQSVSLEPGDLLVLYTDGVTEARDPSGTFFDEENLVRTLNGLSHLPAQTIADRLGAELDRFSPGLQEDDRTVLILRRGYHHA